MKKILILLSVLMLFTYSSVFADEQVMVSVKQTKTNISGNVNVSLSISDNSNSYGGSLNLVYDSAKLKVISYMQSDLLSPYSCFVNLEYGNDTVRFSWAGTEALTSGGELFTITFSPLISDSFDTDITIDKLKLADEDGNKINAAAENGKIAYTANTSSSSGHRNSGGTLSNNQTDEDTMEKNNKSNAVFSDVSENDWFYSPVMSAYENGFMQGVSENEFKPNGNLTRAMFITVMHRISDLTIPQNESPFIDVDSDTWYADAVAWGFENGIISGISKKEFAPNENITREQIATILYRYAKYKGIDVDTPVKNADLSAYSDVKQISDWATDAVKYCINSKVINGDGTGYILPKNNATRAEMATIIVRFIQM